MERKFKIGIVGGCMLKQKGIQRKKLFYSLLCDELKISFPQIDFSLSLDYYPTYNHFMEINSKLINAKAVDLLILLIRPFPYMVFNKPFVKYENKAGRKALAIHPNIIFNRKKFIWPKCFTEHATDRYLSSSRKSKFTFRDINLILGYITGLHRWARSLIKEYLRQIFITADGIKIILVGPPQNPGSLMGNLCCKQLNKTLEHFCSNSAVEYVNIFSAKNRNGNYLFEKDNIHFNNFGQQYLFEQLLPVIKNYLMNGNVIFT